MSEIVVDIPAWMYEKLVAIANLCEKSIDEVAASFFCRRGGSHPFLPMRWFTPAKHERKTR